MGVHGLIAKPFMSLLLLENSNIAKKTLVRAPKQASEYSFQEESLVMWSTPKKSTDLKAQAAEFQRLQD